MTHEGTYRQRRRKANIESNMTERAALLKQHSKKQQHRLSKPNTTERARHAACSATEVVLLSYTQIIVLSHSNYT